MPVVDFEAGLSALGLKIHHGRAEVLRFIGLQRDLVVVVTILGQPLFSLDGSQVVVMRSPRAPHRLPPPAD